MVPEGYLKMCPYLEPEDIAAGLLYVLGAPPHVQVRVVCDVRFYSDFPRVVSLTPWSRFSLEKLTVAKMAEFHYHAHNSLAPVPYHSEINPVYVFHPNMSLPLSQNTIPCPLKYTIFYKIYIKFCG